jgi:PAS domain S-box-containing protein
VLKAISEAFERALLTGEPQRTEYPMEIGGEEYFFECRIVPSGRDKVISIVRNITEEKRIAAALTESEARLRAQYRGIPVPTYTWRKNGNDFVLADLNDEAICASNGEIEQLLNARAADLFWNSPQIIRSLRKSFDEKTIVEDRLMHDLFDPSIEKSLKVRYVPIPPDMVMAHAEDVTEAERNLKALRDSIEELRAAKEEIVEKNAWLQISRKTVEEEKRRYWELFEFAPWGYITTDEIGTILEANQTAVELVGSHRDLLKDTLVIDLAAKKDRAALQAFILRLAHGGTTNDIEVALVRDDKEFDVAMKAIRLESEERTVLRWMIVDITESKRTQDELEESERFNRSIIASSNDCIKILDLDGKLVYINPRGLELLEMEDDACVGSEWLTFWSKVDQATIRPELDKAKAGDVGRFQGKCKTSRGTVKWFDVLITPISDSRGHVKRLLIVSRDITEQKETEEKLHEKERFFRSLVENAHELVTVLKLDGTIVYESPSVERILGYALGERIGKSCFEYIHPDDLSRVKKLFAQMVGRGTTVEAVEYRYKHKSGEYVTLEVVARLSFDEAGYPIVIVNKRDISERKQREEQVHELSVRLLNLQDDERRNLARELHDETAQNLAVIDMNIACIKEMLGPGSEKVTALLEQIETLNKRSLQEVRTVSYLLHPPMLDEAGLVSALRWMIGGFSDRSGVKVDFIQNTDIGRLPWEYEMTLYRIVQEALTNIHRHSGSRSAQIALARENGSITLIVRDEGRGMPGGAWVNRAGSNGHGFGVGIPGMRERLRLLGGRLEINSNSGGTTLTAMVPLQS